MKRYFMMAAASLLSMLAGCASTPSVGIDAYRQDFSPAGTATYALPPSGLAAAVPEGWLVPALAAKGLRRARRPMPAICCRWPMRRACRRLAFVPNVVPPWTAHVLSPRCRSHGSAGSVSSTRSPSTRGSYERCGALSGRADIGNDNPDGELILHALTVCALRDFPLESGTRREIAHCD